MERPLQQQQYPQQPSSPVVLEVLDDDEDNGEGQEENNGPLYHHCPRVVSAASSNKHSSSSTLLNDLVRYERIRTAALQKEGAYQINYPNSTAGWIRTVFVWRGRALDRMMLPFTLVVGHAILYVILSHDKLFGKQLQLLHEQQFAQWEIFYTFVLNSTAALLLVFRLNRAAERFWIARHYWGDIAAYTRSIISGLLTHNNDEKVDDDGGDRGGNGAATTTDDAIRLLLVWALATKDLLRSKYGTRKYCGCKTTRRGKDNAKDRGGNWNADTYAGLLTEHQVRQLQQYRHAPMIIMDQVRAKLRQRYGGHHHHTMVVLDRFEEQLNRLIWVGGGLERIQATPLPLVYVSHLRTFLLLNLLLFPWVYGGNVVNWWTIPMVGVAAFATLGIESAAAEVESPFRRDRVNALNMDGYVLGLLQIAQEQLEYYYYRNNNNNNGIMLFSSAAEQQQQLPLRRDDDDHASSSSVAL
jgi:ion channel-forming bestrophin family protein